MYIGVKSVKPLNNFKLELLFKNGEIKIFDVSPYLNKGIFIALQDVKLFNSVKISFDTIEWDNRADIDPETLYEESTHLNDFENFNSYLSEQLKDPEVREEYDKLSTEYEVFSTNLNKA